MKKLLATLVIGLSLSPAFAASYEVGADVSKITHKLDQDIGAESTAIKGTSFGLYLKAQQDLAGSNWELGQQFEYKTGKADLGFGDDFRESALRVQVHALYPVTETVKVGPYIAFQHDAANSGDANVAVDYDVSSQYFALGAKAATELKVGEAVISPTVFAGFKLGNQLKYKTSQVIAGANDLKFSGARGYEVGVEIPVKYSNGLVLTPYATWSGNSEFDNEKFNVASMSFDIRSGKSDSSRAGVKLGYSF